MNDKEIDGKKMSKGQMAKILKDEPAESDAFLGEGHQRSAKALARAVEELADKDGAIGLEGKWGSGKSTVIKLAEAHFANSEHEARRHHVFTFDLWLHQPEILKLAFLEEFVAWAYAHPKNFLSEKNEKNLATI